MRPILQTGESDASNAGSSMKDLLHFSRLITMGRMSACFAHEIKNPLTLVHGHLRFIEEALPEGHPLRINLEAIDRASRRIEGMSDRMLDFSRKRPPVYEDCDIDNVISDALVFVKPYVQSRRIDVRVHVEPRLPRIKIDRSQILQALVNLLHNAADSMTEMNKSVLTVTAKIEGTQLRIAITDTGCGIGAADLPRIFEPFFTTKSENGTGLGLYIAKQVVEDHNGIITVHTGVTGTTFIISLPL